MFAYVIFIFLPFIIAFILGYKNIAVFGSFLLVCLIVIALGFILGLGLTAVIVDTSYWKGYNMPELWTNSYKDSLPASGEFYKVFAIPYIFLADLFKIYIHFSLTNGHFALWISEALSFYIVRNIYSIYRSLNS